MPKVFFKGQTNNAMDILDADVDYWKSQGWTPEQQPAPAAAPPTAQPQLQAQAQPQAQPAPPLQPGATTTQAFVEAPTPKPDTPAPAPALPEAPVTPQPPATVTEPDPDRPMQEPLPIMPGEREAFVNKHMQAGYSLEDATARVNELWKDRPEMPVGTERPTELEFAPTGERFPTVVTQPVAGPDQPTDDVTSVPETTPVASNEAQVETSTEGAAPDFVEQVNTILSRYGITPPDQTKDPINQSITAYKQVYKELGLPDIRAQFDKVQNDYSELIEKKDREIFEIRDNPYMTEGQKKKRIKGIERKYVQKTTNMLNQMSLYQGLFESGQREAQFVMGQITAAEQQQDAYRDTMLAAAIRQVENELKTTEDMDPDIQEYLQAVEVGGFEGDYVDFKNQIAGRVAGTGLEGMNELLGGADLISMGLPFGTTVGEAIALGKTPTAQPTIAEQIRQQEQLDKKLEAEATASSAISTIDRMLANTTGIEGATGRSSLLPDATKSAEARAFITDYNNLVGLLTLENMNKMTGVLSDSDIKILQQASIPIDLLLDAETVKQRLLRLKNDLSGTDVSKGVFRDSPQVPQAGQIVELEGVNYTDDGTGNYVPIMGASGFSEDLSTSQNDSPDNIGKIMSSIGHFESGGNYEAVGPPNGKGQRAYGKYQVMDFNIPYWTQEALGRSLTVDEFHNSPEAQDQVARHKMAQYWEKYGNVEDVASVWFSGRPVARAGNAADVIGTTVPQYVRNIVALYNRA